MRANLSGQSGRNVIRKDDLGEGRLTSPRSNREPHRARSPPAPQRSSASLSSGWPQQMSALPAAGASTGSGLYPTLPEMSVVSHVWQTPVRQDQRTGTSQASASSSRLA